MTPNGAKERKRDGRAATLRLLAVVAGLFCLSSAFGVRVGLAAPAVPEKFGAWEVRCETPQGERTEQCVLTQQVRAEERGNASLGVILLHQKGAKQGILRIVAPLNVFLLNGVSLKVDQTDVGQAPFFRCFPTGCLADSLLDDRLMTQLSTGKIATLVIYLTPFEGLRHQVKLEGIRQGYERLR
jgi:invasion protein IalB